MPTSLTMALQFQQARNSVAMQLSRHVYGFV